MIKDLLAIMNDIYSDSNLNLKEKSILMYLIKQFNSKIGYAYPKYCDIMSATGIGRRENIAKTIKDLISKGYITVKKVVGNKSHYFIEKYLYFVGEKAQEVNSNEKQKLSKNKTEEILVEEEVGTEESVIKPIIVSDCVESGFQISIDDVEEVKVKQHPNNSKITKAFEKSKKFKLSKWLLDRVAYIDEAIVDIVLQEKPKTAKLFLVKCIEKTLLAGLELAPIIKNTLNFYSKKDIDYAGASQTKYSSDFYMIYTNRQIGLI